ncbi:MAG: GTP 3',8-cyclase [Turneriella sp.]|nr:GTP 3',8-cyclase [Turneriella sp.]
MELKPYESLNLKNGLSKREVLPTATARVFRKLRVSLTASCNFACIYCTSDGKASIDPNTTPVEKFIGWIEAIAKATPISTIRLTGGEPTLYPHLIPLVTALKKQTGAEIHLTTNGHRLPQLALPLKEAGLDGVNISLDAIEPVIFRAMGGRNYAAVIQGVHDAVGVGLKVKINTALMAEMNDDQILPLLDFAYSQNTIIRFLELMPMGHLYGIADRRLVTTEQILQIVGVRHKFKELGRKISDTACHYQLDRGQIFGIIANNSSPFCTDCDRLRLDAHGRIYGCLSNPHGISLGTSVGMEALLNGAMQLKQQKGFTGSKLLMREVGG